MTLGSIIVRLTMNTADFDTDSKRAASIAEKRAKEIDASFRKAGVAIGLALGAAMVGATAAIKRTIDNMDDMSKSAQRVGLATEEFSRLAYAGGLADVEMSTLVSTLGKLTKAQSMALDGTTDQAKVFDALGISVKDAEGRMRSSSAVLMDFADVFKAMDGSPEAMAAGFALFGRSFQDMIPLIKDGSDAIRQAGIESDQLGNTLSTEAGKAAEEFNDNLTRMQTALGGAWKEIAIGMLPQLNEMTGDMVSAAKETDRLRQFGEGLSSVLGALGEVFGFVSGAARQFGVDMGTAIELIRGFQELANNVATYGFADGTVAGGSDRMAAALKNRREILDKFRRDEANAATRADIERLRRNGVSYDGPLLEGGSSAGSDLEAMRKRLQAAFGPTASGGGKKKSGKSDAEKMAEEAARAARQAEEAQRRWNSTILDMEASLAGPVAEAQREYQRNVQTLNADFNAGEVELADYAKALGLYAEKRDREIKSINDRKTPAQEMLADMLFEIELIGKTRDEQEMLTAARYLGAEAATVQGQAALAAMKMAQDTAKATGQQVEAMDALRDSAKGFFSDIAHGVNAWDALSSAFDRFADKLFDMASSNVIDQLFGQMGTTQTGSAGGGWASILGSLFGGGKASGGWAMPRTMYEVNERGFEMASVGGRDYMLTGNQPVDITPNNRLGRGSGSTSITIQNYIRGDVNARTSDQYAAKTAEKLQRASRNR